MKSVNLTYLGETGINIMKDITNIEIMKDQNIIRFTNGRDSIEFNVIGSSIIHNSKYKEVTDVKFLYNELIDKIDYFRHIDITVKISYSDKLKFELACY